MKLFSRNAVQVMTFFTLIVFSYSAFVGAAPTKENEGKLITIKVLNDHVKASITCKEINRKSYYGLNFYYPIECDGNIVDSLHEIEINEGDKLAWEFMNGKKPATFDEETIKRLNKWIVDGRKKCITSGLIESSYVAGYKSDSYSCIQFVLYIMYGITHFSGSERYAMKTENIQKNTSSSGEIVLICKAGEKNTVSHSAIYIGDNIYFSARPGGIHFQTMEQLEMSWRNLSTGELECPLELKKMTHIEVLQREDGTLEAVDEIL